MRAILEFTPELPAWPQLPALGFGHTMCAQSAHDIPGAAIDVNAKNIYLDISKAPVPDLEAYYAMLLGGNAEGFAADEEHFPGLFALAKHRKELRRALAVKGQMVGPVSLGVQVLTSGKTPILYEQNEMELIVKALRLKAQWQQRFLKRFNDNTIFFLDEPSMSMTGSPCVTVENSVAIGHISEVLKGIGGLKGIHCCGNTDWPVLLDSGADILSFDAYEWAHTLALYPSQVEAFLSGGGKLAWGIVPTLDNLLDKERVESLMARLQEGMDQLVHKGMKLDTLLGSSFITPACGLGLTSPANAKKALGMTREVSMRLRRRHGFEG